MITARLTEPDTYASLFPEPPHLFNTPEYNSLYLHKCVRLHHIEFGAERTVAGMIAGERDGRLQSPFSAPYGGFTFSRRLHFPHLAELASALDSYARERSLGLRITLPPVFHAPPLISTEAFVLGRIEGVRTITDLNYHLPLDPATDVTGRMSRSACGALRRAIRSGLRFTRYPLTESGIARAYSVIRANHTSHGYPMNVSAADMTRTCMTVGADLFGIISPDGNDVAAAIVYRPRPGVAQPVGWGDLDSARHMRPMTLLAASLARHYATRGIKALDLGPSTDGGRPEDGLCFFKETLGCETSLKYTFVR